MTAAIFGLLGVVVGALVTGGVDLYLEGRREKKAARRSTRLVAEELHSIWMHSTLLLEAGITPTSIRQGTESRLLPIDTWKAHREVMADALSDEDWAVLPTLFETADALRYVLLNMDPGEPLPEQQLASIAGGIELAAAMYERLTGKPP